MRGDLIINIEGHELKLTNLDKIFWPKEKITKGDLISYYARVAQYILPFLKDYPLMLKRSPDGIQGESFYQKNMAEEILPSWVKTIKIGSEHEEKVTNFVLCQNKATLIYLVNLGCVEFNPWMSKIGSLDNPDYMVIDLDPQETDFKYVRQVALETKELFSKLFIPCFGKTSGSTGFHVYIPLGAKYNYDQAKNFGKLLALAINKQLPDITSLVRDPSKRRYKIYIDVLQNGKGKTVVAPYSVRPKKNAPVSTPVKWEELRRKKIIPEQYNIFTVPKRLDKTDLFKEFYRQLLDMQYSLMKLNEII